MGTFEPEWAVRSPVSETKGAYHLDIDMEDYRWALHDHAPTEFGPDEEFPPLSLNGPIVCSQDLHAGGEDAEEVEWRLAELRENTRTGQLWGGND